MIHKVEDEAQKNPVGKALTNTYRAQPQKPKPNPDHVNQASATVTHHILSNPPPPET